MRNTPAPFGRLADGATVEMVEIASDALRARVITYGAALQALYAPDATGCMSDIVLGHDDVATYEANRFFVGGTVGRFANRIGGGGFTLDGRRYETTKNEAPNTLHGGAHGFDHVLWRIEAANASSVTLAYSSPDGEEGFPGALEARVTYALEGADLRLTFEATADKPTICSLTHHSYFNLSGANSGKDILNHKLTIDADVYTPVDKTLIPTGEIRDVAGTPLDFRDATTIGAGLAAAGGYDHNFALRGRGARAPKFAARLEDPASGRALDILTTEPALQFYSGQYVNALPGKDGAIYRSHAALCLEPQHFPDAPNQPTFPSARLDPAQTYRHISVYRFSAK